MFCTQCGVEVLAHSRFCGGCGTKLVESAPAAPSRNQPPSAPSSECSSELTIDASANPSTWRCPACKQLNRPGTAICACGHQNPLVQSGTATAAPGASADARAKTEVRVRPMTPRVPADPTGERLGITGQCHLCGGTRPAKGKVYEFGLGKSMKLNWGGFGAAAVAAVFGVGLSGPTRTGHFVRLRLALCDRCAKEKRVWGSWLAEFSSITETDCQKHPWWSALQREGYQDFINGWKIRAYPGE